MVRVLMYVVMITLAVASFVITRMRSAAHVGDKRKTLPSAPIHVNTDTPEALEAALHHKDWRTRQAAILKLGEQATPEAIIRLTQALNDEDSDVRQSASDQLIQRGADAVHALSAVLETGSLNARQLAAAALGEISADAGVPALIAALKDGSLWVRNAAAEALGKIAHPDAIDGLTQALRDPEKEVVQQAAAALQRIGTPQALEALGGK